MAKEWKSLWENYDRDDYESDKAKQPADSDTKKRRYSSDRDNDDKDDRTILGFDTRYTTEDSKAGTDYGGYGYSGYSGYGYYDELDDTASEWYRRSSFRYGRGADYSPSSQFRSTFSGRYYSSFSSGSAHDDAKNKAIRALRNLTRSANTIVDKTSSKAESFAVQFSAGSDSNGVTAELNEEKKRIVFVSPDELLATTTTEDEDAVIDALTGFVLLRVQISQDVKPDVIGQINATGLHTAAFRMAETVIVNKDRLAGINPKAFSQETTDDYLAGVLAKSMLTKLARRNVVSSWGGFTPYFIRHAKKFAAVRENLEKAPPSVETAVSTLGYNMLADETPLELPKEINDIAAKHLGTEVAPEELLDKCRELVAEIRALFSAKEAATGEAAAGAIEKALEEMMANAQAEQGGTSAGDKATREFLSEIAGSFGEAFDTGRASCEANNAASEKETNTLSDIKKASSLETLLKNLENMGKQLEEAKKLFEEARSADGAAVAAGAKNNIAYAISSRPAAESALKAMGIPETEEFFKAANAPMPIGEAAKEQAEKLAALLEAVSKQATKKLKARRNELKTAAESCSADIEKRIKDAEALVAAKLAELAEKLAEMEKKDFDVKADEVEAGRNAMKNLPEGMKEFKHNLAKAALRVQAASKSVAGSRSLSTLLRAFQDAVNAATHAMSFHSHCFYDNYSLHTNPTMARLSREMSSAVGSMPTPDAVRMAVDNVMSSRSVTDAGFMSALVNGFMSKLLSELHDKDAENYEKKAKELGISPETLSKLMKAFNSLLSSGKTAPKAEVAGKEAAEKLSAAQAKLSPVDRHLFGDKIEAASKILDGSAIGHVNDEARHAAEEDYVAYLDHNDCKPHVVTRNEDEGRAHYRENRQVVVQEIRTKNRNAIERIRNALQFQGGKRTVETYGLRSGDLDEGNLHKLSYDCEHIWSQKTLSKLPDVAVGILVDQSGSMSGLKISQAREICITLAEAIRKIVGVRLYVYGHTANMGANDNVIIYEHYTPAMGADMSKLGGIVAHCNNYDGYAVKDVAKRLAADTAKKKYLFVIADGLPSGNGYGGDSAEKHVTSVCKFTRDRLKIGTYAFAVGVQGYQQEKFKRQYGDKHVVFVDNVTKCLPQIVRFLRNAMQQERKLVTVED
ncbi:hypothetical protein EBZ39_00285 [bacterium]|nr:hypothetical protein [bacterium]